MVSAQTEVPVHVHRTQQLGAVCKVSLGSSVSPSSTHQSPSINLSPSSIHQSLSIFHPSSSLHLPPINLPPSSIHQPPSIFHPSTSLHLPSINLSPSYTHQSPSILHPINLPPSYTHQSFSTFHPSISLRLPTSYHCFPTINLTPPLNICFHQCHLAFLSLYLSIFARVTCLAPPPSPSPGSLPMVGWWYRVGTTRLSSCGTGK